MTSIQPSRARRSGFVVSAGLLAFAFGMLAVAAGVLQRYDGALSWGGRSGPMKKLAREDNPALFDRVTWGLILAGGVLTVGGLGVAYVAQPRRRPHADDGSHAESAAR